jgi:flagellin-like protein
MERRTRKNRGVSPVISSIVLTAMVLVIGAGVWGVSTGASSIIQTNYYEEVMESVEKIKERFCIEHIGVDKASNELNIWIYNYGPIDIMINLIRVTGGNHISSEVVPIAIPAGGFVRYDVTPTGISLMEGLSVSVEVRSDGGNKAYESTRIL